MRRLREVGAAVTTRRRWSRFALRAVALAAVALMLSSCGMWPWRGISNVELPGGPGTGSERMTIYVQMPDTLALNVNSRVRVADVFVRRVRAIELKNWVATLTLDMEPNLGLPSNALARIGQTSLLGSQNMELKPPPDPSGQLRGDQIREFLNKLDTFTDELNQQTQDITRAIDSTNRLLSIVAQRNDTLDQVLTEFPPLIKHFAETRDLFADAVEALGRVSVAADNALAPASDNLHTNLQNLQYSIERAGPSLPSPNPMPGKPGKILGWRQVPVHFER